MKYIYAEKSRVIGYQISVIGHRCKNSKVVLNEKEVMNAPSLQAASTLEEKAALLGGTIHTAAELIDIINRK